MKTILLLEDDKNLNMLIAKRLEKTGTKRSGEITAFTKNLCIYLL